MGGGIGIAAAAVAFLFGVVENLARAELNLFDISSGNPFGAAAVAVVAANAVIGALHRRRAVLLEPATRFDE